jgi:hypothetical protein
MYPTLLTWWNEMLDTVLEFHMGRDVYIRTVSLLTSSRLVRTVAFKARYVAESGHFYIQLRAPELCRHYAAARIILDKQSGLPAEIKDRSAPNSTEVALSVYGTSVGRNAQRWRFRESLLWPLLEMDISSEMCLFDARTVLSILIAKRKEFWFKETCEERANWIHSLVYWLKCMNSGNEFHFRTTAIYICVWRRRLSSSASHDCLVCLVSLATIITTAQYTCETLHVWHVTAKRGICPRSMTLLRRMTCDCEARLRHEVCN